MKTGLVSFTLGLFILLAGASNSSSGDEHSLIENIEFASALDVRGEFRMSEAPVQDDTSLGEARLQLEAGIQGDVSILIKADLLYDIVPSSRGNDLERGHGWIDLREANIHLSPTDWMDAKAGRQILTWGKGDLLFINDLFPKDWQSFFVGRKNDYLKSPSDAVLLSVFPGFLDNLDIAYTPRFDPDRFITGQGISYWNPILGHPAGENDVVEADVPDEWFDEAEISVRAARTIGNVETDIFFYDGFWKSPAGLDPTRGVPVFPELSVYGASCQGSFADGILTLDAGYYNSRDDSAGDDPFVPNSEIRGLLGYEKEVAHNLIVGMQY